VTCCHQGREIKSEKVHADHFTHQHPDKIHLLDSPAARSTQAYFKYSDIDPLALLFW